MSHPLAVFAPCCQRNCSRNRLIIAFFVQFCVNDISMYATPDFYQHVLPSCLLQRSCVGNDKQGPCITPFEMLPTPPRSVSCAATPKCCNHPGLFQQVPCDNAYRVSVDTHVSFSCYIFEMLPSPLSLVRGDDSEMLHIIQDFFIEYPVTTQLESL